MEKLRAACVLSASLISMLCLGFMCSAKCFPLGDGEPRTVSPIVGRFSPFKKINKIKVILSQAVLQWYF